MDIVVATTIIAGLFLVIGLAEPLAARLRLPYGVMLAVVGLAIGLTAVFFLRTELTDALNPVAEAILGLPIRANVFLYVFLPTLLFQVTLALNVRRALDDWVPILVLSVLAVIVATLVVGQALAFASALPLMACLLIGAIVSTTDPSAVVGIFRSIAAPRRLGRIIEGESLLNDAAAIALFGLFITFVMTGVPDPDIGAALMTFPWLISGGVLVGWAMARLTVSVMAMISRHELAQISVSIALPYLSYVIAEQLVGASGVIAVVASGITLNILGPGRLSPASWSSLRDVWDLLAHWAGALIFVLAALLIPRLLGEVRPADLGLIAVVVAAATFARVLILFVVMPLLVVTRLSPVIERPYRIAILWGGLRGAVTLALALAVTENALVPAEIKRLVGILATGFTLFTLIVQGSTLRWVISRLGLDRLSPLDAALSDQVIAVALQSVRESVAKATENYGLTRETVRAEAKRFGKRLDEAVEAAEKTTEILNRDRITLGLVTLAGAEREMILSRFRERAISARLSDRVLFQADYLIEMTRTGGRTGYQQASRRSLSYSRNLRFALMLHNRLGLSGPLSRMTADRFENLLLQRLILRDLHSFINVRIRRIHGPRVAELLHELLDRRVGAVSQALEGLRLQYPGYAEELERRFIRRTALRLEEGEYEALHEDGLIGSELHQALRQDIAQRRRRAEGRPMLDLTVQKAEMVRLFPLFVDLEKSTLDQLGNALVTRYVAAGERIIAKDSSARSMFFIASGAVELETAGHSQRLGRGEMFGQMQILTPRRTRAEVRAIAPSTLLVLDEARFLKLLRTSPELQAVVGKGAEKRGVHITFKPDGSIESTPVQKLPKAAPP